MTENEIIKDKKKTSKEWLDVFSIDRKWIYDPDGWDRSNFVFSFEEEKITAAKFEERLTMSTILFGEDAIKFPLVARSDYEPKPEVVKCEIKPKGNELRYGKGLHYGNILEAVVHPDFVGLQAGPWMFGMFRHKKTAQPQTVIPICSLGDYEVLTPTHVLFRSKDG